MDFKLIMKGICPKCGEKLRQTYASLSVFRFFCDNCEKVYYVD